MTDDARQALVADAERVCDVVRATLGPFGSNQMLVRESGDVITTASGATVVENLDLSDPATTLLTRAAEGFRDTHGDGTASLVTLTGALLDAADDLTDRGVHPTAVAGGFRRALDVAADRLDEASRPLSLVGPAAVAETALTATRDPAVRRSVGGYVAEAAHAVEADVGAAPERNRVKVAARIGGRSETELVRGLVLEQEPVSAAMPREFEDAGVALLSSTVDRPHVGGQTGRRNDRLELADASFETRAAIGERERDAFRERLAAAVDAGCRLVVTERAVNERVRSTLADHGVAALQRVERDDVRRLALATGAQVVPSLAQVTPETLGRADVRVRRMAGRDLTFVESEAGDPVYTLFCRAPDPRSVASFETAAEGAVAATLRAVADPRVVPGGGAIEMDLSRTVREASRSVSGREQLAMAAYADALTAVPRALAVSAGLDGWEGIVRLRVAHDEGRSAHGVDALLGETRDVLGGDSPVVEPAGLKRDVLGAATDLAAQLVRVDDRLDATDLSDDEPGPPPEGQPVAEQ